VCDRGGERGQREAYLADPAADKVAVDERTHPYANVKAFSDDIDVAIGDPEFETDLRIAPQETR